jgi:hypothetical protein
MSFSALDEKKQQLVRKAKDGSVFVGPITVPLITSLTTNKSSSVQTVAITGAPTGGTFTLTFSGQTTASIAYNATAAVVRAALEALTNIGAGNVRVTGGPGPATAWVVTFVGPMSGAAQAAITATATGLTGGSSPAVTITQTTTGGTTIPIDLRPLPYGMRSLGYTTTDGVTFARSTDLSETRSFGSVEPVRTDVTTDTVTMASSAQQTQLETIGLYTGADYTTITADATTGEVGISKPDRPSFRYYRALGLFVDDSDAGEIYFGRYMPRARVTEIGDQQYQGGDEAVIYPLTWTGYKDATAGYSHRWIWGGPGWNALLADMNIPTAP